MPPKKADPNAPILVHEDVFLRGRKFIEAKIAPTPPKGELTSAELCIPPQFHSLPELKGCVQFWSQQNIIRLVDPKIIEPSRPSHMKRSASDQQLAPRPRKEIMEVQKYYKGQLKQAEKRTGQFLKQLEKSEAKQDKRNLQIEKVNEMEKSMSDELREAREYSKKYKLFEPQYMNGSKYGEKAPKKNVWIVAEASDVMTPYVANVIDEITKFVQTVLDENCACYNVGIFGTETWMQWCPTYQNPKDPKKGSADSLKWLNKQLSTKLCGANEWPPNWVQMIESCLSEGLANPKLEPTTIYVACSRPPDDKQAVFTAMEGKGVPLNVIAFDDGQEDSKECADFFTALCGPKGGMQVDTSMRDLAKVDAMLNSVKTKKKQLDKLQAQLAKMEDMTEVVAENKRLLAEQISCESLIANELEVIEEDAKNPDLQRDPDGNIVLPPEVQEAMAKMGRKVQI